MMKTIRNIAIFLFLVASLFFVLSCAQNSTQLLSEDYKKMDNDNLLRYYYTLNDEIERQEKQTTPQFGIGIGGFGGGYGHHGAEVGGGVGVTTGGSGYTADDLRARRIDVLMELKKRKINP